MINETMWLAVTIYTSMVVFGVVDLYLQAKVAKENRIAPRHLLVSGAALGYGFYQLTNIFL